MLNSSIAGITRPWPIYYNKRQIGYYQGTINPHQNPNVRAAAPKIRINLTEKKLPPNSRTIYQIVFILLFNQEGTVPIALQVNVLEGLRYLDGFHPNDEILKDLPR